MMPSPRMDYETRSFNVVGTVSLNYGYNLSGQLTSISDSLGASFAYTYDAAGRLSAMTGAGLGTSTFISGLSYRAWGAPKQITYGNNLALNFQYNSRLEVTRFESAGRFGTTYDYQADGRVGYSHDLTDNRFDRAYQYDHAGRIKEAFSGAEARGQATADGPYRQSYAYDVWDNATSRTSRHWTQDYSFGTSYVNNRDQQWQHDADGRPLLHSITPTQEGSVAKIISWRDKVGNDFDYAAT